MIQLRVYLTQVLIHAMSINHGVVQAPVSEKLSDKPDVNAAPEQVRCQRVPENVRRNALCNAGFLCALNDHLLRASRRYRKQPLLVKNILANLHIVIDRLQCVR